MSIAELKEQLRQRDKQIEEQAARIKEQAARIKELEKEIRELKKLLVDKAKSMKPVGKWARNHAIHGYSVRFPPCCTSAALVEAK